MPHQLLLDAPSLTYRAFFALPASIKGQGGQPVNAVRGYLDMVARLMSDRAPDEVVHVADDDYRPAARVAAYPAYKADRAPEPEELTPQFAVLDELLDALGQTRARAPGWEADDAIGTLCAQAAPVDHIGVVTGDRDLFQLVRDSEPRVEVLYTVKGVSQIAVYDEAAVRARYGVPPGRYVDFATLRGDPSDGLPGVRGVGEKTALGLVEQASSIPALLEELGEVTPRVAAALEASRDYLEAMREVVPVRRDVEIEWARGRRDDARADVLAERWNVEGPVGRLRAVLDA